ncbi:Verrucotoxin subunit beta [Hypsibius exemplaris]|uniref:Verrucotoxin subunit beta n=1 Tax=Hypsibius exemplaris TaxID=2072580 RepID=A0A1W0WPE7_HYPEX|nr:Verrucotoxin subunit beta [Hypsibius exemplaris]
MSKPEFLEISAMGRSFHLGMLYDARSDKPIPEITLWEEEQIKSNISITKKLSSNTAILTSDSLDEKAKAMKMSAGLKLSFLGGLVSVTGAAEYMLDDKSSVNESRVALQFSCMTRSEVLAVTHMGPFNEQNARVLDASIATHVVAGIEYGADAFLVFSRTDSDSSKMSSVKGELESAVNAIKTRSISGQGKLDASESDKLHRQNISCKFYGDFILPHNPSNYEEAVAVYKALRDMLGENYGNAVAKLVILCPLSVIDGKPERIVREIGAAAMEDASNVLRSLSEFKLAFTDTSSREARECFPWIRDDIDYFEGKLNVYEINFRAELAELLKKIRGNEWEEQALHELLAGHFSSPFSKKSIETWIGRRKQEIHLLQGHLKTLKNDGSPWIKMCLLDTELNTVLYHDHKTKHVLCLELCLLEMVDPFLKAVGAWVDSKQVMPSDNKHLGWFENPEIKRQLRGDIEQFLAFAERNRNPNSTKFVVNLALARGNGSITNTRLHSQEASVDFVLPGKPDKPDVTVAGPTKFVVTWQPPGNAQGNDKLEQNITGYQCSYRPRSLKVDGDWKTCLAGVNYCVELTDVTTRLAYEVNISAITAAGASEGSDVTVSEGKVYPAKRCLLVSLIVTSKDYGNFMASLYGRPIDVKDARLLLFDIDTNEHKMLTVPLSGSSIKPSLRNFVFRNNRIYFLHKQRSRNAILRYDPENNSWSTVVIRPSEISIQADHMDGYATDGKLGDEIDAFAWFDDQLVAFARTKDRVDGRGLIALKRDNFSGFWKTDGERT